MSYLRRRSRQINQNVYLDNRLSTFTNLHMRYGNLSIENNENVGNDLDVCGNLVVGHDLIARNYYSNGGNFYLDNYILIPYGTIIQSAAVSIPDGWLNCNGASISTLTYANLFSAIGYTYGGSGSNFNIPDIQGRVVVGTGSGSGLSSRTLGQKNGEETHILTTAEMPSHSHTSNAIGGSIGLITANGANTAIDVDSSSVEPNLYTAPQALTIDSNGSGNAHNNMQPFIVLYYLIKY
jgi:microcystin-dependent protein